MKLFNISLILIIFCNFGYISNKVEADSKFLKNAEIIQQSLQRLKTRIDKTAKTYRSLQQEKIRLAESCERLQLKIHELTNLESCINNCTTTTTFPSVRTTIVAGSSTIGTSESPTTTQPKKTTSTTTVGAQCQSNPCQNHGTCQPDGHGYVCLCALGYVGMNCENSDCYQQHHPDGDFFIISSPGYSSGIYPNLWACTFNNFTFGLNDGDNKLWLNFLNGFSLEDQDLSICSPIDGCCDYVAVYDGPDTDSPLIGRYCGSSWPNPIYSTSSSLTVEFHSDMSTKGKGFAATVGRAIPNDTCGDESCTDNQFCYQEGYSLSCKSPCDLNPCLNLATCVNVDASSFRCDCQQYNTGPRCGEVNHAVLVDCQYAPLLYTSTKRSGLYTVYPDGKTPIEVYCETIGPDTWTVIMNHVDDTDFNRTWSDYVNGFGYANGSHWIGLDNIYKFVHNKRYSLRIDMTDCEGNTVLSEYELFDISNGDDNYRLSIAGYDADQINGYDNGNDAISPFNNSANFNLIGQPFSTFDKDNTDGINCGAIYGSGWWWGQCYSLMANPMGKWYPNCKADMPNGGIQWNTWKDSSYSLYRTSMKLLRQHY